MTALSDRGWAVFPAEPAVLKWAGVARDAALKCIAKPDAQKQWLQCEGTWFVGVDTLPNGTDGAVEGSGPLCGAAYNMAQQFYGELPLHRGQVSVIYPGYPRPRQGENEAAFQYRLNCDAAHVDGLLAVGPARRRMLKERHSYILGLPLSGCDAGASPLVIWEGSHHIMRAAFAAVLGDVAQENWADIDLTEAYQAARREVFERCPRVTVAAQPGAAYLIHRHALHGIAPWQEAAKAPPEGRMIAYFRPELPGGSEDWLRLD
ncbi:FIG00991857: hypothetical protein [hydrothermal vent metagenome]|uniref:Phytanoyl-CoA dioxygenase n=1 Tax=hydrothermal vent metagenome TaxID=652676 RepID=A0A3B0S0F9_9ZZZZ